MKKVRSITSAKPTASTAPTQVAPPNLTDPESRILRHLITLQEQVSADIGFFVGQVLTARQLNVQEWSISLADCKTLVKKQLKSAPAPAASAVVPPAPPVPPGPKPLKVN